MSTFSKTFSGFVPFLQKIWHKFSQLALWAKVVIVVVLLVAVVGIILLLRGSSAASSDNTLPTVTVESISSFGGGSDGVSVLGTVQSVSEADLLAQSAGTVEAVHTTLGASVPAGFVVASLDSAAASAAVLQAQGAYDAALAAEKATSLQSQNSSNSVSVQQTAVKNTYESTYSTLDSTLSNDVDVFFGAPGPVGPQLAISPLSTGDQLPRERQAIKDQMSTWRSSLTSDSSTDPLTLLLNAQSTLDKVSTLLTDLGAVADQNGSGATASQLAALGAARTSVNGLLANITAAQTAYNAAVTASAVGQTQSNSGDTTVTSSQASVEEALGGLRAAQAAYEKTIIRAPIGGTINYLPIHVGDYVTSNQHVATVARNNALEIVMYLSQDDRNRIEVGNIVSIMAGNSSDVGATTYKGVVTTIAPALDPTTKQIEVHIAVNDGSNLVNGQSVQVELPALIAATGSTGTTASASTAASVTSSTTANIELPLTAVKLLPNERDVFSVDASGHIVAHPVEIGDVVGDLIQVTTPLPPDLKIVIDARGLSSGDAVLVASSTTSTAAAGGG